MAAEFDETDFIDADYQAVRHTAASPAAAPAAAPATAAPRPPTREELDAKVHETQSRLEELKRVQEQLERERTALEEARRRRAEYQVGRGEMIDHLTRGVGLLEESEFNARRDAEQLGRTLTDLREHLQRVQDLNDQVWTQENYAMELTRALTAIENARLEWNSAQLKWPQLGDPGAAAPSGAAEEPALGESLARLPFAQLCRLGLALTWPVAVVAALAAACFALILWQR